MDWNEAFQSLLAKPDSLEKFNGLAALARDFRYVAESSRSLLLRRIYLKNFKLIHDFLISLWTNYHLGVLLPS